MIGGVWVLDTLDMMSIYGGALLLVDVKSVDVMTIKSLMPLMMSIKAFDLGTYA